VDVEASRTQQATEDQKVFDQMRRHVVLLSPL